MKRLDPAIVDLAALHQLVVTIEDNGRQGGVGATVLTLLSDRQIDVPVQLHGVEQEFLDHAKRDVILSRLGLTVEAITAKAIARLGESTGGQSR